MKNLRLLLILFVTMFVLLSCGKEEEPKYDGDGNIVMTNISKEEDYNNYLKLFGRTYFNKGRLALDHCATGFEMKFKGTEVEVELVSAPSTTLIDIFLDGEEYKTIKLSRNGKVKIAKDLENKEHYIRLIKASSTFAGVVYVSRISVDDEILKYDKTFDLKIEFVGDSITCGAGVLTDPSSMTNYSNSDVTKAYSYICAEKLKADFTMSAVEGISAKVKSGLDINSIEMYGYYSSNNRTSYTVIPSDVVVVDIGTNDDGYRMAHPEYINQFYADYKELIDLIRIKNPNAKIVCTYGHMWTTDSIKNVIVNVVNDLIASGDNNISYFQVTGDMTGGQEHPGLEGAKRQGEELYQYIKTILGE